MTVLEKFRADIEEGQRLRGWMTNAYAQIEFMLGDLILRCRVFPEYEALTKTFTHSAAKRAARVVEGIEVYTINESGKVFYIRTWLTLPEGTELFPYFMKEAT